MRICIDLDGVITRLENLPYAYRSPVIGTKQAIDLLRDQGHYIILHTARRMRTHEGNVGRVIADIGFDTLEWLRDHEIKYDEIIFGKPFADVYIDDNALRFTDWNQTMRTIHELDRNTRG